MTFIRLVISKNNMNFLYTLRLFFALFFQHSTVKSNDKLLLNPVQLMELILKQHSDLIKNVSITNLQRESIKKIHTNIVSDLDSYLQEGLSDYEDDEEIHQPFGEHQENGGLSIRRSGPNKVWSEWSTWSKCSTSCGAGIRSRRRSCMAGHCAPGEWEQRVKPCCRAPC